MHILRQNGFAAVVVGGCVRDACMGIPPHDFDMATDATPDEILRRFADHRVLQTGIAHGTATILLDQMPVELTTFRIDGDYADHRHPTQVTFTDKLEQDLARRDLTINAMAYDGARVIDPFGGQTDLARQSIRCVGDADRRFDEDGLRILRAMRFAAVLSFSVESRTAEAMHRHRELLRRISAERIWAEFGKLLRGENASVVLAEFSDVLGIFLPQYDENGLRQLARAPADPTVRLALLLQNTDAAAALRMLRADNRTIRAVTSLLSAERKPLRRMLSAYPPETVDAYWDFTFAHGEIDEAERDALRAQTNAVLREKPCLRVHDLAVNGTDLQAEGFRGAQIGQTLTALLNAVLDDELPNEKDALLLRARSAKE